MLTPKQWIIVGLLCVIAIFAYDLTTPSRKEVSHSGTTSGGGTAQDKMTWKLYHPQNDRFEVLFPMLPQHVAENHPNGVDYTKYDVYLAQERDGSVYLVSMTQYPSTFDTGNGDELLEGVLKGALGANQKNQLTHSEKTTFLNLPALEFDIKNGDFSTKGRALLADKTLYVLTVMARDPIRLASNFSTFANSFVIKNSPQPQSNVLQPQKTEAPKTFDSK